MDPNIHSFGIEQVCQERRRVTFNQGLKQGKMRNLEKNMGIKKILNCCPQMPQIGMASSQEHPSALQLKWDANE